VAAVAGRSGMSIPVIECVPTAATRRAIRRGWKAYHDAVFEYGPSDEWDKRVIDQAIRAIAKQGQPFSVNDFRHLIPEVRACLISRRLIVAQHEGLIEFKTVTSTSRSPVLT
jgi:hypothetical protein